jgi:hypothetical protein
LRTLVIFAHAGPAVWTAYHAAAGDDVDWLHINRQGLSSVYRQLAADVRGSDGSILPGLLRRYPPPQPLEVYTGPGGGGLVLASFSAGYGLSASILASAADRGLVDGVVAIDSWHAGLDPDGTASDADLAPLVAAALRAREGGSVVWLGHTDVPTVGYASTTQVAEELLRLTNGPGEGLSVEAFDEVPGAGWSGAATEHRLALTRWGPGFLGRAIAELRRQRALWRPTAPPEDPELPRVPLGQRSLVVARAEQQAGIDEASGWHRIRQYFDGCERSGAAISGAHVPKSWAWCAAGLSYCMGEASRPGEQLPHRRRIAVRELWADAVAAGTARPAAAVRRGDYVPQAGDAVVLVRGGYGAGPEAAPFVRSSGRGHVGRIVAFDGDSIYSLDANIADAWTDCERLLSSADLVGVIAYPQPEAPALWSPTAEEVAELRRLIELSDAAAAGEDFDDWRNGLDSVEEVEID